MDVRVHADAEALGAAAAAEGAGWIGHALAERGRANVILATGASQFTMLDALVAADLDWSRITVFHLDEYVGLPPTHPASFRRYLRERVLDRLATRPVFVEVDGTASDLAAETARLGALIAQHPIDVCFAGIGENGHLAFNDPPADFDTDEPYIVVNLDDACRRQQLGEGWFPTFDDVPKQAISMSIGQIMKSAAIICTVPDERKAEAVRNSVEGEVTPMVPASILQRHKQCTLFLDKPAASLLQKTR